MTLSPVPAAQRSYHHGDLRRALIQATLALVEEKGVGGFTMAEAARRAGVSVAAPYRHFADKEALVTAAAVTGFDALNASLTAAARDAPHDPVAVLAALGTGYVRFALGAPAQFDLMFAARIDTSRTPELRTAVDRTEQVLLTAVQALPPAARTPAQIAQALWALVHGVAALAVDDLLSARLDDPTAPPRDAGDFVVTWLTGLAALPSRP